LAAIYEVALVGIERRSDFFLRVILRGIARLELRIAAFADTDGRERWLYDSELEFLHDPSV
jgi:hypothetical protein